MKKGKRYIESAKLVDKTTQYAVEEALDLFYNYGEEM